MKEASKLWPMDQFCPAGSSDLIWIPVSCLAPAPGSRQEHSAAEKPGRAKPVAPPQAHYSAAVLPRCCAEAQLQCWSWRWCLYPRPAPGIVPEFQSGPQVWTFIKNTFLKYYENILYIYLQFQFISRLSTPYRGYPFWVGWSLLNLGCLRQESLKASTNTFLSVRKWIFRCHPKPNISRIACNKFSENKHNLMEAKASTTKSDCF